MNLIKLFSLVISFAAVMSFGQVQFSASNAYPCVNQTVTFNSTGIGVTFSWDMGDGTVSSGSVVNHQYTQGGGYWVSMDAYDSGLNYLGNYQFYVEVTGPPNEIWMPSAACPGDEIALNVYMQDATAWSWDLGDGTMLSGSDYVNHTYTAPGTYYPEVTISSACGTFVVQDTIVISNSLPYFMYYANMWVNPDSLCPNTEMFASTYSGFAGYNWDFGDGNSESGDEYTDHIYTSNGTYTVTLTLTNGCAVDTVLTHDVVVSNATPVQNPQIDLPDTICPNATFYAGAWSDDGVTYEWNMGDGSPVIVDNGGVDHSYSGAGSYNVSVTITNDCGNSVVLNETVVVDPNAPVNNPYFSVSSNLACPGDHIEFWTNTEYSYYIDYGDGTGSSTEGPHSYNSPGTYIATVTLQNACGNSVTVSETITIQNSLPINSSNVGAWFYPDPACPTDPIEFESYYGFTDYEWNFDDGSTGMGQEIDHIFNAPGVYNVGLTVTNGCGSQATTFIPVTISDNVPIDDIDMHAPTDTVCLGDTFFAQAEGSDGYQIHWDLGDGTTHDGYAVTHAYDALGTYVISMTATNGCGNDSTITKTIVVSDNYTPNVNNIISFVEGEGCVGDEEVFVLIPSGLGSITWDFGDGNSTSNVSQVFVQGISNVDVAYHTYSTPGVYWATYTVTNSCGNSVSDSVQVTIGTPGSVFNLNVDMLLNENQTVCQETPVEFMAVGAATYIWDFGDGSGQLVSTGSLNPVYHTYANAGSYSITVQGVDACGNMAVSEEQIVIPPSKIIVSTNTVTKPNCDENNGLAVVSASGGIAPYTYSWTNGDQGVIADSLQSGIYVVTVTDINGCSNEGSATVSDQEGATILVDNVVDVNCFGEENGSISVSLLGGQQPYTILWSNGDQTEDIFGLQAGPYEIFVTDANGCFAVQTIEVTQPSESNISVITHPANCGGTNGLATATINNGTPPYNYIWPNATGPSNQTGALAPGIHTLYVIDGNTCLLEKTFAINEKMAPIILTDSTVTGTCNGTLSSIYISTIGGQQPFIYDWSNSTNSQDLTGVLPGTYVVEVTGGNGCSSYANYVVAETQPDQTTICMVDVDTNTQTNLIVWAPLTDPGIASYNIYKESSQAGLYYLIGNQSSDSLSQYFDINSDPGIRSWRYKIAAVDDCGNEAQWSDEHKTMHLTTNQGISGEINLIWDKYEGFAYSSYYINRYHPSTGWVVLDTLPSNLFSYTDFAPPGDSSLIYRISIETPQTCTAEKAQDYNSSRSNNDGINLPAQDDLGQVEEVLTFSIYPNPTNGIVQIRYDADISGIALYDMSGKLIYNGTNFGSTAQIDMTAFERGVYNVQLITEKGVLNGKIIRE